MTGEDIRRAVRTHWHSLRTTQPDLDEFVRGIEATAPYGLVGGAPRDWTIGFEPRDIDIAVDAAPDEVCRLVRGWSAERTGMGGFRVRVAGNTLDVWSLRETWAIAHKHTMGSTFRDLAKSAFFDVDAVVVVFPALSVEDEGVTKCLRDRTLSILFEPNPRPKLCAEKALRLASRYRLQLDRRLADFVRSQLGEVSDRSVGDALSFAEERSAVHRSPQEPDQIVSNFSHAATSGQ